MKYLIGLVVIVSSALVSIAFISMTSSKRLVPSEQSPLPIVEQIEHLLVRTEPKTPQALRLEQLFDDQIPTDSVTRVLFVGDVLLARSVNAKQVSMRDFTWSFAKVADTLRAADMTVVNLETPLVIGCPIKTDGMVFCGDPRNVEGLVHAGVDVVSLANNHAHNYGHHGVAETAQILHSRKLQVASQSAVASQTVRGTRFAIVALNDTFATTPSARDEIEQRLHDQINSVRSTHDIVIIFWHWGVEYQRQPTARQRALAHKSIELGADVVIGAHPHWYQTVELYRGKLIAYSLGNFIFDQMWSKETREGIALELFFRGTTLVDGSILPVRIEDYGQPRWLSAEDKQNIIETIYAASTTPVPAP